MTIVVGCIVASLAIVVATLAVVQARKPRHATIERHTVTRAELAAADGKNGQRCYAAVDGTVYQISDSAFWERGQHTPSEGLAYCGADLSKYIDQSPHGRKMLQNIPVVGPLTK